MRELLNEYNELTQAAPFVHYIPIVIVIILLILGYLIIRYKKKHSHDTKYDTTYDVNHLYKYYPGVITVEKVNNTLVVKSRSISFPKTKPFINKKANNKNVIEHECQDSAIYDCREELLGE